MIELVEEKRKKSVVKGIKFERAKPSDILDIYGLIKQGYKENVFDPRPTERELHDMYWDVLDALAMPDTFFIMAKRGRGTVGFIQAKVSFRKVGPSPICSISFLYVTPKKRKLGIGKELMKTVMGALKQSGIHNFELLCNDEMVSWYQKLGAKKRFNFMVIDG